MIETQHTVSEWAERTFGVSTPMRAATRMNEEVAELLAKFSMYPTQTTEDILDEIADVQIVLYVLAGRMGMDLVSAVDRKMAVNRARKWKLDGSGCGQHE